MNKDELKLLQNYPLDIKIEKSKLRIREWYENFNGDVYVSFSGGKDSTVLLHLVRSIYPEVEGVFMNTGIEFPQLLDHVRKFENITELRPKKPFHKVIKENGYPVTTKSISHKIGIVQRNGKDCKMYKYFTDETKNSKFNCSKWEYLIDAPFKIDNKCCNYLKKYPVQEYEKQTNKKPFIGTMACESVNREISYLQNGGCNAFNKDRPISTPLGFWTEQDILEYIVKFNLSIPSVYGEIKQDKNGKYYTTGLNRTGCMYCGFGAHLEKSPNRYELLKQTNPKHYEFMLNKLGFKDILDLMNIKY